MTATHDTTFYAQTIARYIQRVVKNDLSTGLFL